MHSSRPTVAVTLAAQCAAMESSRLIPLPVPGSDLRPVSLREWKVDDAPTALEAGLDPVVSRYRYSLPRSPEAAQRWIEQTRRDREDGVRLELAILERKVVVGSVSLTDLDHNNATIRCWLLPTARGRGLASHAVWQLCTWAFAEMNIGRVTAIVEPDNQPSAAVLERCGFMLEGRLRRHMTGHDGIRVDTLLYGLLPEDLTEPAP
jgi:RimJ/RimL family protein N-acetyltransferase